MSCTGWKNIVTPGIGATSLLQPVDDRSSPSRVRWSRGRSVMASRPALGVALIGRDADHRTTTPVTSGSLRIAALDHGPQPLHLGERDFCAAFHHREDEAGVLQRQKALRNDDVEPDGGDQRAGGHR